MKRFSSAVAVAVFALAAASLRASDERLLQRPRIARIGTASATSYSAEVPVVTRIQGTAFFRTSVDINNNTNQPITVEYQFSYTCLSSGCAAAPNNFFRTTVQSFPLAALANFHQDDFVDYLNSQGLLQTGAEQGTIGSLLVTFSGVTAFGTGGVILGSEASVVARTYNHLDENTPSSATVGFAYNASLFFESADTTLIGTARDTKAAPSLPGTLRSNVGVRNTDINGTQTDVTVQLSFYDTATGQRVGNVMTLSGVRGTGMQPGEVQQIPDIFTAAAIPSGVHQIIVFVDNPAPTGTSPTFEGYVTIVDGGSSTSGSAAGVKTQDASYFDLKCADANLCAN